MQVRPIAGITQCSTERLKIYNTKHVMCMCLHICMRMCICIYMCIHDFVVHVFAFFIQYFPFY